jgi:cell division septum initiation protein DivIVA
MASDEPRVMSISSNTALSPEEIPRRTFPTVRKGVDPEAVRRYLETVAEEIRVLGDRETQLRRRLAEAERRASEPPVLDEQSLTQAVGAETARILQTAHDAARDVVAKAESSAAELIADAERQAAEQIASADGHVAKVVAAAEHQATERTRAADETSVRVLEGAQAEAVGIEAAAAETASSLRETAQAEADELLASAQASATAMIGAAKRRSGEMMREARERRKATLTDLTEQRRALYVQLEQLRSGRDHLVQVVDTVGEAVEAVRDSLESAEHGARLAAAEAGERAEEQTGDAEEFDDEDLSEEEVEALLQADMAEAGVGDDFGDESGEAGELAGDEEFEGELDEEESVDEATELAEEAVAGEPAVTLIDPLPTQAMPVVDPTAESPPVADSSNPVDAIFARIRSGDDAGDAAGAQAELDAADASADEESEMASSLPTEDAKAAFAKRDAALGPITTRLSRALKRALQDDQNELLDAIRHSSGAPNLEVLLPNEAQRDRYARAAASVLSEAWLAGRPWLATSSDAGPLEEAGLQASANESGHALAAELADDLVGLLRHRLAESLENLAEIGDGAQDAAGAAYREWKGSRIEGSAGDFTTRAFAAGAVAAGLGQVVVWLVDDNGKPCPDCDDNALAGDTLAGDEFPTGQLHPPVHPGCRCLLVRSE